jgi:tetratricopeptide (TPR) repeat protein
MREETEIAMNRKTHEISARFSQQFILFIGLIGLIAGGVGCSSVTELKVESNPEGADVSVIDSSKAPKKVGVTPFTLNKENTSQLFQSPIQVNVSKDGYKTQSVFVPETNVSAKGELVVQLQKDDAQLVNLTAEGVAEAQRLVFKRKYAEAERMLQEYLIKSPSVAVLHSLLGNVFYLEKDSSRALEAYERAQALEPGNVEVAHMIEKLKGIHAPEGKN